MKMFDLIVIGAGSGGVRAARIAAIHKDVDHALRHLKYSKGYLEKIDKISVMGAIPELYSGGKANENTPLAWAHSFHIIALQSFINSLETIRTQGSISYGGWHEYGFHAADGGSYELDGLWNDGCTSDYSICSSFYFRSRFSGCLALQFLEIKKPR